MFTEIMGLILELFLAVALVVAGLIFFYSFFAMLPHVRGGIWSLFLFHLGLSKSDRVEDIIEPKGTPHYHRIGKASFWCFILGLCLFAFDALRSFLES